VKSTVRTRFSDLIRAAVSTGTIVSLDSAVLTIARVSEYTAPDERYSSSIAYGRKVLERANLNAARHIADARRLFFSRCVRRMGGLSCAHRSNRPRSANRNSSPRDLDLPLQVSLPCIHLRGARLHWGTEPGSLRQGPCALGSDTPETLPTPSEFARVKHNPEVVD
jgi:hypothetical protein